LQTVQWNDISRKEFALNSIGIITSRRDLQADSDHGTALCV
jgi:hypothetical protein